MRRGTWCIFALARILAVNALPWGRWSHRVLHRAYTDLVALPAADRPLPLQGAKPDLR